MQQFIKTLLKLFSAMGEAKYAANLAYNRKIKEAQAVYKD